MNFDDETVDILYNEVKEALNAQFESITALNTKLADIMKMSLFTLGVLIILDKESIVTTIALLLLWCAFLIPLFGYMKESYRRDPDPLLLKEKYIMRDAKPVKVQIMDNVIDSYTENKIKIELKSKLINPALLFLMAGVFMALVDLL
ncbi:MAG: hypothetical protein SVK08_01100 [Halobacteriota archaeon]|nr:hypothetical protein [Halobacteriota archaeon]